MVFFVGGLDGDLHLAFFMQETSLHRYWIAAQLLVWLATRHLSSKHAQWPEGRKGWGPAHRYALSHFTLVPSVCQWRSILWLVQGTLELLEGRPLNG